MALPVMEFQVQGYKIRKIFAKKSTYPKEIIELVITPHSDLNDPNLFHSTIDAPPGVPGVSKNPNLSPLW